MADTDASVNQTPIYVPSLGKAFRAGGWDYEANAPTGARGSEYEPGEWEAEQAAVREPEATEKPPKARRANKGRRARAVSEAPEPESGPTQQEQAEQTEPTTAEEA